MKQVTTLSIAILITVSSFASVSPLNLFPKHHSKNSTTNAAFMNVSLKTGGKVSILWMAGNETTTTYYNIEKSVNGGAFKTLAVLMGESNDTYFFHETLKDVSGNVEYRVVTMDNGVVVNTLSQNVIVQ
jgi:hypothetical protein